MSDLSLISLGDLWEEICKRNSVVIMATIKVYDDNREAVQILFHGGKFTGIGLAKHVLNTLEEEAISEDDDLVGE